MGCVVTATDSHVDINVSGIVFGTVQQEDMPHNKLQECGRRRTRGQDGPELVRSVHKLNEMCSRNELLIAIIRTSIDLHSGSDAINIMSHPLDDDHHHQQ